MEGILSKIFKYSLRSDKSSLFLVLKDSTFFHKVLETFATRVFIIGIGVVTTAMVSRILGPEGRGLYAIAIVISAMGVQFCNLGLHTSNTYFGAKNKNLLSAQLGNSILVSFGFGTFIAVSLWMFFQFFPEIIPVKGFLLILSLASVPLGLAYLLVQNLVLGLYETRLYNRVEILNKILSVLLIAIIIFIGAVRVEVLFLVGFISSIISLIWVFKKIRPYLSGPAYCSFRLFNESIKYGFKAYLAALFAFLVIRVDLLMVQHICGTEQAGLYSVSVSLAEYAGMVPIIVATILFPRLSAMHSNDEKMKFTFLVTILIAMFVLGIALFLWVFAEPIIRILYGPKFINAKPAFVFLLPGMVFIGTQTVLVQFLNSIGFPKAIVYVWGSCLLLNIGLNLWMIPRYSIAGASMVSSICSLYVLILVVINIYRTVYATQK
ncbi:MAG: flippase [Nitrospiria bacterium]